MKIEELNKNYFELRDRLQNAYVKNGKIRITEESLELLDKIAVALEKIKSKKEEFKI